MRYGDELFPECKRVARLIAEDTSPGDRIVVLGSEPEIYFYARRRSAIEPMYMYPLLEPHDFAESMQRKAIRQIESIRPEYVVFVNAPMIWLMKPGSKGLILDWMNAYVPEHYDLVGRADHYADGRTLIALGREELSAHETSEIHLLVFKRKQNP